MKYPVQILAALWLSALVVFANVRSVRASLSNPFTKIALVLDVLIGAICAVGLFVLWRGALL